MFSRAIWKNIVFEKLTRACFFPNCTQKHILLPIQNMEINATLNSAFLYITEANYDLIIGVTTTEIYLAW
jgi:hypothetical protein